MDTYMNINLVTSHGIKCWPRERTETAVFGPMTVKKRHNRSTDSQRTV